MARDQEPGGPYLDAIRRGFQFARAYGRGCGPVDLLVGISEGDGPAAAALDPGAGRSLRAVVAADSALRTGAGYLHMQAQGAARSLAESRGQRLAPWHLLIALLDQGTPEVLQALSRAGLDPAEVRRKTLSAVSVPAGLPPVAMPALDPAGTMDRPPLPVADLDARAWSVLRWRQDHLPLRRLHSPSDAAALDHLERGAAWQVATRLGLGDDQRYSLISHHADAVHQAISRVPGAAGLHGALRGAPTARAEALLRRRRWLGRHHLEGVVPLVNVTAGWGVWMQNRQAEARDGWFRLRTSRDYRGSPQP
jgi:hypothetical protein